MARPQAKATPVLEDRRVRVTRWDFEPGAETGWHRHELDYLVVPLTDCPFLLEEPDGNRRVDVSAGSPYRRDTGVEHNVVNAGEGRIAFIEVEIKT